MDIKTKNKIIISEVDLTETYQSLYPENFKTSFEVSKNSPKIASNLQ